MKTILSTVVFSTLLIASSAMAYPRRAACVGGPRAPSYAFNSFADANACAQFIARQGGDCAKFVKIGDCHTDTCYVDTAYPSNCRCGTQAGAVGRWY